MLLAVSKLNGARKERTFEIQRWRDLLGGMGGASLINKTKGTAAVEMMPNRRIYIWGVQSRFKYILFIF
jgi:hypothetical protein